MHKQLTVLFNTYQVAFVCAGGGEVQLLACAAALRRRNINVLFYDHWHPQFEQADVVHFFSVQGGSLPFCAMAKQCGLPLALSPVLWLGENKYDYALDEIGQLLRLCDVALPNSMAEGQRLSDWYTLPLKKFVPIVNGVDNAFFSPISPDVFRHAYAIEGPFILSVANIEPRKNQHRLLQAAKGMTVPVLLFGQIRDPAYWERCQTDMPSNVRYLGPLQFGSEMHRSAYAACSVFALPTRLETPGLAALEAAALGARICITKEGCTSEYLGEHAVYVNPEDPADIRHGLQAALVTPRTDALAEKVRNLYTWDRAAAQLEAVYRTLLCIPKV